MLQRIKRWLAYSFCIVSFIFIMVWLFRPEYPSQPLASMDEQAFKDTLRENQAFLRGDFLVENADLAWEHQQQLRLLTHRLEHILSQQFDNGLIPTHSRMGVHGGFTPAVSVEIDTLIEPHKTQRLLDIGAGYGLDSIALVKRYPNMQVTALEIDSQQIKLMEQLAKDTLADDQKERFSCLQADFLSSKDLGLARDSYDMVVISRVLHFYPNKKVVEFLNKVKTLVKPGGYVIITNVSRKSNSFVDDITQYVGGYIPMPTSGVTSYLLGNYVWINFMGPEHIRALAGASGFEVRNADYIGTVHEKGASQGHFFQTNLQQFLIHAVLRRPTTQQE